MNRLMSMLLLASVVLVTSCSKVTDTPSVEFRDTKIVVSAKGGELVVPVVTTGVDEVNIIYEYSDRWERDEDGNLIPMEGWIELVKVIDNYAEPTRELIEWRSAYSSISSLTRARSVVLHSRCGAMVRASVWRLCSRDVSCIAPENQDYIVGTKCRKITSAGQ